MSSDLPPANIPPIAPPVSGSAAPATPAPTPPGRKKRRWLLYGCGGLLGLLLLMVATVAFTIWYIQRPVKPVVLSADEKVVVEKKLTQINGGGTAASGNGSLDEGTKVKLANKGEPDRIYTPGSKELRITERELNGLLNDNTGLGNTVRIELGRDAINAYVVTPIPQDVPLMGGKMFRARGRFRISVTQGAAPYAILEDVTVFGLSLPKDWLGGIKGENLLGDAMGDQHGKPVLKGIKSLRVEPGVLILEVGD